jgi:ribosomal protein S18 acetylase RimI-like enzyme
MLSCWENGSLILVAADQPAVQTEEEWVPPPEGGEPPLVYGFCQADVQEWQQTVWINHLIVDRRFRRHSIGTALLSTCVKWARQKGLERIMVAVQTKNYPGIAFCQKHGFAFCGFNEHYFPNRDIAVLLALKI